MQGADYKIEVGRRLAEVRKDQKLLQPALASDLKISESAYKNYERGERELPLKVAHDLCELFDVNPAWLVHGYGVKYHREIEALIQKCETAVDQFFLENKAYKFKIDDRAQLLGKITSLALKAGKLPIHEVQEIMKVFVK